MSAVAIGPGARSLERELLREVREDQERVRRTPALAARSLRLVVPSRALRIHLASALLRDAGPALLGIRIQTLVSLAREILEREGAVPEREDLFPILVRREARREPGLRAPLDDLADGYGAVRAGVDDLLDAGFSAAHADVVDDALAAQGLGADAPERALVRVAGRVGAALGAQVSHRSRLFAAAREALERDAAAALPARGVAIYGFSDATGVQADLLAALIRHAGASAWLELPRDGIHGAALRERLRAAAGSELRVADAGPARTEVWRARDPSEEARAIAGALRARLDAGAVPEQLAVIARDLGPYALALRRHLAAFAIPFSSAGEPGPVQAAGRRLSALQLLLREGEATPAERWLELLSRLPAGGGAGGALSLERRADLQQALHTRGCAALRDVPGLAPERIALATPSRIGPDAEERIRVLRREVGAEQVAALAAAAAGTRARLAAWPASAPHGEHAGRLRELVRADLGWDAESPGGAELEAALADARALDAVPLERDEFLDWLSRALADAGRAPLGGAGAGVQLLSVMQARGLTFEHIHVCGLTRGLFPRPVREDPLLPDRARRRLRDVLPELPVKREGFDEERFLFAQLLAASPSLTLSYPEWDDEGGPLAPSPLLEALARAPGSAPAQPAPAPALATPRERARDAGLFASREDFGSALEIALEASGADAATGLRADALARARVAVLAELDAQGGRRRVAGPYLGFAGRRGARDARSGSIAVTSLEGLSRCSWQLFLRRLLGLDAPKDARGPLPQGSNARLLGNVVHAALEEIAAAAPGSGGQLSALRPEDAQPLAWPDAEALEPILLRAARESIRRDAIALDGYAVALARRARPFVREVQRADWLAAPPAVLGGEVHGVVSLKDAEGAPREVHFRIDRIDRIDAGGALRLTDYKTGRPPKRDSEDPVRQQQSLREKIAQGALLQAAIYAATGERAVGRYLFLAPDLADAVRELAAPVEPADRERLEAALRTLLAGWDAGAFVPRLREPASDQEPGSCRLCEVKDACLRGDSGVRLRLGAWAESAPESEAERAALAVWRLPEVTP